MTMTDITKQSMLDKSFIFLSRIFFFFLFLKSYKTK